MTKRILSFLLCFAMVVGMFPMEALAVEEQTHTCVWHFTPTEDALAHTAVCEQCGECYTEEHCFLEGVCQLCGQEEDAAAPTQAPEQSSEAETVTLPSEEPKPSTEPEPTESTTASPEEVPGQAAPACPHTVTQEVEALAATCTQPGKAAGVVCGDCGEVLSGCEELPAPGHSYVQGVCSACGFLCTHSDTEDREESLETQQPAGTYCLECGMLLPEEDAESSLPYGFAGTPEGYTLTEETLSEKQRLLEKNVLSAFEQLEAGTHYEENAIMFWADTEEEAQLIAQAYSAQLCSYGNFIGVAQLTTATVGQAFAAALDAELALPLVEPVYISEAPVISDEVPADGTVSAFGIWAPELQQWEDFKDGDPALRYPNSYNYPWYHDMVNTYGAWGVSMGSGVTVAVIDYPVDSSHQDLSGRVTNLYSSGGTSFYTSAGNHGTHVAGIIAAAQGNGYGGAGVAPKATILSVGIMDNNHPDFSWSFLAQAINAVVSRGGVQIINMSLGGPCSYSSTLQRALNNAYNHNITVFAASGNTGSNAVSSPAAMDHVIAVASVNRDGTLSDYSNYGTWVDLSAPGQYIYATLPGNKYGVMSGTSMACPVASGIAALYISALGYNPGPDAVEKAMKKAVNRGTGSQMGTGIIDASKLFSSDKTAPSIGIYTARTIVQSLEEENATGVTAQEATPITGEEYARILADESYTVAVSNEEGDARYLFVQEEEADLSTMGLTSNKDLVIGPGAKATNAHTLVYTTDGSTPTMKEGLITNGYVVKTSTGIRINLAQFATGKRITVKAAYISGMGVMSKVATYSFTVNKADYVQSVRIEGSAILIPGKSATLTAIVEPVAISRQDVTWEIISRSPSAPGAKISSKGLLTTRNTDSGFIRIRATSKADPSKYATIDIILRKLTPVKTLTLDRKSDILGFAATADGNGIGRTRLKVTQMVTTRGKNVLGDPDYDVTWTSSNPSIASVDSTGLVTAQSLGKVTITCTATDGSKKNAKCTITVVTPPDAILVSGQSHIAQGKSAGYKLEFYPASANKTVQWRVEDADGYAPSGITITSSGRVTVSKTAPKQTFYVKAYSITGSTVGSQKVTVSEPVKYINIYTVGSQNPPAVQYNKNGTLKSLTLYSSDVPETGSFNEQRVTLSSYSNSTVTTDWSTSNASIVSIENASNGMTLVAHKAGKATITCTASDGSGKRASVSVTVTTPASYITIESSLKTAYGTSDPYRLDSHAFPQNMGYYAPTLATGKSANNKATLGSTYGKAGSAKIRWSFEVFQGTQRITSEVTRNKLVTLSSAGKLSVHKNFSNYYGNLNGSTKYYALVYATVDYGTHTVTGSIPYRIVSPTSIMKFESKNYAISSSAINNGYVYKLYFLSDCFANNVTITSSNPKVLSVAASNERVRSDKGGYYVSVAIHGKGSATITMVANDGSGKRATTTMRVK